jgi:hypothetical protein
MLRPLGFFASLVLSAVALAQPPAINPDLTKHWTPELGECPQVLWIPEAAPSLTAVSKADSVETLLNRYPYQAMVQGSWVTLRIDGKVETIELMDYSADNQLFRDKRYLVSLLRKECKDLNSQEALCDVSVVARRLDPPIATVLNMVEYYGCYDDK